MRGSNAYGRTHSNRHSDLRSLAWLLASVRLSYDPIRANTVCGLNVELLRLYSTYEILFFTYEYMVLPMQDGLLTFAVLLSPIEMN